MDEPALRSLLSDAAGTHRVVGCAAAVLRDGEIVDAAHGLASAATGVEATPDTLFQIGSITKLYTASIVMLLAELGSVDVDATVRTHIADLRLTDETAASTMTLRHLLSHTAGVDGDNFDDHGRGDDCVERLVRAYEHIPHLHPVGALASYSNAGFVFLGRVVELVTGRCYEDALRDLVVGPLGLRRTASLPEDVILHRYATGHFALPGTPSPVAAPQWSLNRSGAPAGSTLCTTPRELLEFVRTHLEPGALLSEASVAAMQQPQFDSLPRMPGAAGRGLAWALTEAGGRPVVGHGGLTMGGNGQVLAFPGRGIAVAVLSNTHAGGFAQSVLREVARATAGVDLPSAAPPVPSDDAAVDPAQFTGSYVRYGLRVDVTAGEAGLVAGASGSSMMAVLMSGSIPPGTVLRPAGDGLFVSERGQTVAFRLRGDDGRFGYLDLGGRVLRRTA